MKNKPVSVKIASQNNAHSYEVRIGFGLLSGSGVIVRRTLGRSAARIGIVADRAVYKLYGNAVVESLSNEGFRVSVLQVAGGERSKSLARCESVLRFFADSGLTRTDGVVALGGGVIGDLVGFAASIYLRGVAAIYFPTTLLSMVDSSVGGKTGVNSAFGKNTIGTFHDPESVIADIGTLSTLPKREITAGLCEMIKHAAISGDDLMEATVDFLDQHSDPQQKSKLGSKGSDDSLAGLVARNIEFKAGVVAADRIEAAGRNDTRSRKILNFGHTLAHALETVTNYKYFRHGEAVGYGILFAAELSKKLALCVENDVKLLYDVVHRAGELPSLASIDPREVFEAFRFDKKNIDGSLQFVLLRGIGKPVIVSSDSIPREQLFSTLERLFQATHSHSG